MTKDSTYNAAHWRTCAEEARAAADSINDARAKLILRRIAKEFDLLAKRADLRSSRTSDVRN